MRRWFGHDHIPRRFAGDVNRFAQGTLSPFLNFHRPCLFATEYRDAAGRICRKYLARHVMTPYARFRSLPGAEDHLKPGVDLALLDAAATAETDVEGRAPRPGRTWPRQGPSRAQACRTCSAGQPSGFSAALRPRWREVTGLRRLYRHRRTLASASPEQETDMDLSTLVAHWTGQLPPGSSCPPSPAACRRASTPAASGPCGSSPTAHSQKAAARVSIDGPRRVAAAGSR